MSLYRIHMLITLFVHTSNLFKRRLSEFFKISQPIRRFSLSSRRNVILTSANARGKNLKVYRM